MWRSVRWTSAPSGTIAQFIDANFHLDYAGNQDTFLQTCPGICYDDWVAGSPSNYDNAYFEVQYVRVYGTPGELTVLHSGSRRSLDVTVGLAAFVGILSALTLLL